jgi:hypothetical protein
MNTKLLKARIAERSYGWEVTNGVLSNHVFATQRGAIAAISCEASYLSPVFNDVIIFHKYSKNLLTP